MTDDGIRWAPVSETSVMLYLADEIDVELAPIIGKICQTIKNECPDVCEVTPSYTSILVEVHAFGIDLEQLGEKLLEIAGCSSAQKGDAATGKLIELPVFYDPEVAPDLEGLADHAGLSIEQVIELHTGRDYTVCAIGFAPGFAFLAEVDERIAMPRHTSPRSHVSAGSVGIAERQTAVYPADTPGGWQLIGNCPIPLYDPRDNPPSPFTVGDKVRFVSIDREAFTAALADRDSDNHAHPVPTEIKPGASEETPGHGLTVFQTGVQSFLQDLGRIGHTDQGVSQGGAMDLHAHCWVNQLLGNNASCATLEVTVGMAKFRAETDMQLAIAGADMQVHVDGSPVGNWCSFRIKRGQQLTLRAARVGMRAYLAVAGGFLTHECLGSVSTVVRNQLGGLNGSGKPIQKADFLPASSSDDAILRQVPQRFVPDYPDSIELRVIESCQASEFTAEQLESFYQSEYILTQDADRMGARLEGEPVAPPERGMISEGIPLGAIQIPPDGQPIILLNDRQTLGGYPKLGCVARVDLPKLAQARPGTCIRFTPVSLQAASDEWREFCEYFKISC